MHLNCDRQPAPAQGNLKKLILKDSNTDKKLREGKKRKQRDKKEEKVKA